jgi:hypothetical protein
MSMTKETLDMIELDAAIASTPMLDHYIKVVQDSVAEASRTRWPKRHVKFKSMRRHCS